MEPLRPDQQHPATLTLAEAVANDPLVEILAPDPARRVKLGPPMMGYLLAYGMRYGRVWSNDDASAVAIWLHPESGPMTMSRNAWLAANVSTAVGCTVDPKVPKSVPAVALPSEVR